MIEETIAPQPSHNTKKAFKIIKKMCKHIQANNGKVLPTPEILEDYMKKPRHCEYKKEKLSKEYHKDLG